MHNIFKFVTFDFISALLFNKCVCYEYIGYFVFLDTVARANFPVYDLLTSKSKIYTLEYLYRYKCNLHILCIENQIYAY